MAYTVKLGPDTVLFVENGNKLKLRDSSFKNVHDNSMAMIEKINGVPVQDENAVSSEPKVEAPRVQTPSINSKRVIKDASGLVGQVVSMTDNGRKPVKIKPAVAESVAKVGQRALASISVSTSPAVSTDDLIEKATEIVRESSKSFVQPKASVNANANANDYVVEPFKNRDGDFSHDTEEIDEVVEDKTEVASNDLPEEPTISIPVDEIKKADTDKQVQEEAIISNEEVIDTPIAKTPKVEAKAVNLDDVREMQEKLDEVGKATIEVKQKVVKTKSQIDDVRKSTEVEKKDLEKLNKDQEAAREKSEMLKQKTCEFLQQQMELLEGKKTDYFNQLSDYEITLEQVKEEKKQIEMEKEKQEIECQKAKDDLEAWAELHKAITNKAAEFDSQLGQEDDMSKVVSFRDLVTEKGMDFGSNDIVVDEPAAVKRIA